MEKYKATVTSKGQITIPLRVRKHLGMSMGDELEFEIDESSNVVTVKKSVEKRCCDICSGQGVVEMVDCPLCSRTGLINDIYESYTEELNQVIANCPKDYDISYNIVNHEKAFNKHIKNPVPRVTLFSDGMPNNILHKLQDYFQLKAIIQTFNREDSINLFDIKDETRNKIMEYLLTIDAQNKLREYFG